MTAVDRRPTVARNFLAGDRRSVEWALEQWLSLRPPVDQLVLQGEPLFVCATALGLLDLGRLRGGRGAPFQLTCHLPAASPGRESPVEALVRATGVGRVKAREVGRGDLVIHVDGHELDGAVARRLEQASDAAEHGAVAVVPPEVPVPASWRVARRQDRVQVFSTPLASLGLCPEWEGMVEDRAPRRLCVAGSGWRVLAAAVACGDFFLEREAEVPSPDQARLLLNNRVVIMEDACKLPGTWHSAERVWQDGASLAGAQVVVSSGVTEPGVLLLPARSARRAA